MPRTRPAAPFLLLSLVACGTTAGYDKATDIAGQFSSLGNGVTAMKGNVDAAIAALDALPRDNASGARSAFGSLSSATDSMLPQLTALKQQAGQAQLAAKNHFDAWAAKNATITDAQLKGRANERHAELASMLGTVDGSMQKAMKQAEGFGTQLQDLQKYLSNDLSPASVGGAGDLIARMRGDGNVLSTTLNSLAQDVDHYAQKLGVK
jgi:hypothetical protein